jgi:hypothetical protein
MAWFCQLQEKTRNPRCSHRDEIKAGSGYSSISHAIKLKQSGLFLAFPNSYQGNISSDTDWSEKSHRWYERYHGEVRIRESLPTTGPIIMPAGGTRRWKMSRWEAEALLARVDQDRSDHYGSTDERRGEAKRRDPCHRVLWHRLQEQCELHVSTYP